MMLERLKNYIKANTDVGEGIQLGGIDGNTEKYIGVYPGKPPAAQRVCLGGAEQTRAGEFYATVLVHWGRNMRSAQAKADAVFLCESLQRTRFNRFRQVEHYQQYRPVICT